MTDRMKSNTKELSFLRREVTCLDKARINMAAGIEVDQKLLCRRFQLLVNHSRVRQAQMSGDKALERQLRRQTRLKRAEVGMIGQDLTGSTWNLDRALRGNYFKDQMVDFSRSNSTSPQNVSSRRLRRANSFAFPSHKSGWESEKQLTRFANEHTKPNRNTSEVIISPSVFHLTAIDEFYEEPLSAEPHPVKDHRKKRIKPIIKTRILSENSKNDSLSAKIKRQLTFDRTPDAPDANGRHSPDYRTSPEKRNIPSLVDIQLRIVREVSTEYLKKVNGFCAQMNHADPGMMVAGYDYYSKRSELPSFVEKPRFDHNRPSTVDENTQDYKNSMSEYED